ncbi:hypothetical protein QVD17_27735 [Tagetes erecta]|uniref:Uncharacterized protein n=1 Tax=Tagetes erecta TaxID=13708 RepID=A0AAD8NJS4_TARER|nr:hypothetical protein QVD17_27735 [Tagetes erecta]
MLSLRGSVSQFLHRPWKFKQEQASIRANTESYFLDKLLDIVVFLQKRKKENLMHLNISIHFLANNIPVVFLQKRKKANLMHLNISIHFLANNIPVVFLQKRKKANLMHLNISIHFLANNIPAEVEKEILTENNGVSLYTSSPC